jgi:Paraquat-inducible protein A
MKHMKLVFSVLIFLSVAALGTAVIIRSKENQTYKAQYAEINHFKYGLFSVDTWKEKLSYIIVDEIEKLSLTQGNEKFIKKQLQVQLGILIDKMIEKIKKENYKTAGGWVKQGLIDSFIDVGDIKKGIPEYADAIYKEMSSRKTEKQIKAMLKERISEYIEKTYAINDTAPKERIIQNMQAQDEEGAKHKLNDTITANKDFVSKCVYLMIALAALLFVIEAFDKKPLRQSQYFLLTLTLLVLLAVGVSTPMIDMEAKISQMKFVLFDHPVEFTDQVLYFQTKSIMDVFWVMITHREIQMKLVGILMVCFSVVFPVFKILSSLAYYYDYCGARKYKVVQFFVLKSGKWSMADVMVVAVFMAYIGFNGIINAQLANMMTDTGENFELITTNGTALQPGYYVFFAYTILAMFLASFLKNRPYECAPDPKNEV